jgi:uncharacterized protein (TIGR00251 family)
MMAGRDPEADHAGDRGAEIAVRLQPRARANEIVRERGGVLLARVTAPPLQGRANHALRRLISRQARVGIERVQIVRGAGSRQKTVRVHGLSSAQLRRALLPPGAD